MNNGADVEPEYPACKEEWLEGLMNMYGENLTKLAYNYVKDWKLAEDIVQDVFVTCYHHFEKIEEINSIKSCIYRISINKSKDVLRSSAYRKTIVGSSFFSLFKASEPSPEMRMIKRSEEERLSLSVLDLPVKYREIIILYYYEELSVEKICEILNMNPNTVKTRLNRGRAKLKNSMERRDSE
ncbi:sigma-70 family RNA polymerase sigma factor [Bacillus sp. SG-1]|uniref:sigma-70 family RNA polymerase sigma factor n=1 Tax=Bacillus sp. SG-1 TaxID=161544 RepID=UPI000154394A|nr:sigma-70 family RNA polymerase sigma factor [Bacillus sp. SG-1]EDL65298.1 RNA polymerase sigma C factor [Bacillus sp. SG-1]